MFTLIVLSLAAFKTTQFNKVIPFEVVIARFNEDLSWVEKEFANEQITIYNKGKDDIDIARENINLIKLPNVGRESHTYLYHITTNYRKLAKRTLFLQGNPYDVKHLSPLVKYKESSVSGCRNIIAACSEINIIDASEGMAKIKWENNRFWPNTEVSGETLIDFLNNNLHAHLPNNNIIFWTQGAQFAVPSTAIKKFPKKYYKKLLLTVSKSTAPIEGHYFERLWDLVFDK